MMFSQRNNLLDEANPGKQRDCRPDTKHWECIRGTMRARRRPRGQSMVEFALVAPALFLVLFGAIDLGRAVAISNSLVDAARTGARYAYVNRLDNCTRINPDPTNANSSADSNSDCLKALTNGLTAAPLVNQSSVTKVTLTFNGLELPNPYHNNDGTSVGTTGLNNRLMTINYSFHPVTLFFLGGLNIPMSVSAIYLQQ